MAVIYRYSPVLGRPAAVLDHGARVVWGDRPSCEGQQSCLVASVARGSLVQHLKVRLPASRERMDVPVRFGPPEAPPHRIR
jgi:hypothetical protein